MSVSAGFLILGRLEDIVHFTKQGKLEYYEGNFDAFRQGCHGIMDKARHGPWIFRARQKTQLDAEGAKDVGPPNGVEKWEFVNLYPRIHRIYQNVIGHIINDLI